MPRAHRHNDSRKCGAKTIVSHQNTVFVNNKLWAVETDLDTHCNAGALIAVYGPPSVKIENKYAICAVGDNAELDYEGCEFEHPKGSTAPLGGSGDTFIYEGGTGGGTVA